MRRSSVVTSIAAFTCLLATLAATAGAAERTAEARAAAEVRLKNDVTFLASDQCEGRGVGTKGIELAADHIAELFRKAGLKPAGTDGSYFQPFSMSTGKVFLDQPNSLVLRGPQGQTVALRPGVDFQPLGLGGKGKVDAPIVFVGYGASSKEAGYDDYAGIDVKGKIVVVLRKTPRPDDEQAPFDGNRAVQHAALRTKVGLADANSAAALIFVNDRVTAGTQDRLMDFTYAATEGGGTRMPVMHMKREVLDDLLRTTTARSLAQVEAGIDHTLKPASQELAGWTAAVESNARRESVVAKNVVGYLEGKGPLANEIVILGAHYDHLGFGGRGSLARGLREPTIHHGADDNASGTSVLLELVHRFGAIQGQRTGRRIVFMAFSGEESGLIGSDYYCKNPIFPLEDTVTMVNLDMVGRMTNDAKSGKGKIVAYGTGTDATFDALMDKLNDKHQFQMQKVPGALMVGERSSSDHASFYARKVPVIFFFTGTHQDYHKPSDTSEKVNLDGMCRIADLTEDVLTHLTQVEKRPSYVKVAAPHGTGGTTTFGGPTLGIMPDYADDKEGLLLSGVSDGRAAAKAGLKSGDRIVEIGGKAVKNIETYMVLMKAQRSGQPVEVVVVRDGKKVKFTVKPE